MDLPVVSISKKARRHLLRKGAALHISRHPKAGRPGYSPDQLVAYAEIPAHAGECVLLTQNGITVYLDPSLSLDKYEQLDVWTSTRYWVFHTLHARITIYRRFTFDE